MNKPPIITILRGLKPAEAIAICSSIYESGIRIIEVPLNSPEPLKSIEIIAKTYGKDCLIGAGTVLTAQDVEDVYNAGGKLIVTPNTNPEVIEKAVSLNLRIVPGFITPTEAFAAVKAGAKDLKLFPATSLGPNYLKALKEVLPKDINLWAVGGTGASNINEWIAAGAKGIGVGGALYKAGDNKEIVLQRSKELMAAYLNKE